MALTKSDAKMSRIIFYAAAVVTDDIDEKLDFLPRLVT